MEGLDDTGGAEQVHLDSTVERAVECNHRRRVHHDVAAGEDRPVVVAQPEPVGADVAAR